jgi:hypothetical protein
MQTRSAGAAPLRCAAHLKPRDAPCQSQYWNLSRSSSQVPRLLILESSK